jgi:hypothetical protein
MDFRGNKNRVFLRERWGNFAHRLFKAFCERQARRRQRKREKNTIAATLNTSLGPTGVVGIFETRDIWEIGSL